MGNFCIMNNDYTIKGRVNCACFKVNGKNVYANNCSGFTTQETLDLKLGNNIRAQCETVTRSGIANSLLIGNNCDVYGIGNDKVKMKQLTIRGWGEC